MVDAAEQDPDVDALSAEAKAASADPVPAAPADVDDAPADPGGPLNPA